MPWHKGIAKEHDFKSQSCALYRSKDTCTGLPGCSCVWHSQSHCCSEVSGA